jgi:hypothetical protein
MLGLNESFTRFAAHALRRRVGIDELRVLRFDALELVHKLVEVAIRKLRVIEGVVEVFVVKHFVAEGIFFWVVSSAELDD